MQQAPVNEASDFAEVKALAQQGHLEEAKARLLAQLQIDPKSLEAYNLLGILDSNQQDFAGAQAAFQKALQIAPNSTKTHTNLGNLYIAEKKIDLAETEFRKVLRLDFRIRMAITISDCYLWRKGYHQKRSHISSEFDLRIRRLS
jgi:Flp pilus assembly protein TadD